MANPFAAQTIDDMLKRQYAPSAMQDVSKIDAPVITSTTAAWQAKFGAFAYSQLNQRGTVFNLLPKEKHVTSGFRAVTARATALGSLAGSADAAALDDTVKPTWATLTAKPKLVQQSFEIGKIQEYTSQAGDDALDPDGIRQYMGGEFAEHLDQMICTDADTLASTKIESIDRVCSATAEATAGLMTAGDEDIYGIDRSAQSWADAQVLHNSGTDRAISKSLLRQLISLTQTAGANPAGQVFITGPDTAADIDGLFDNQVFYPGGVAAAVDRMNESGAGAGTTVGLVAGRVYGIPLYVDTHVTKDTKSRVYLVDMSKNQDGSNRLAMSVAQLPTYTEEKNVFVNDRLSTVGLYTAMMELKCTFLAAQGKLRDLA